MSRAESIERKTPDQLRAMRAAGLVVARALSRVSQAARPGVTTGELDLVAREVLAQAGAVSSFLGYDGGFGLPPYPATTCISVNDEVVHGIPGERALAEGDLVSVDFGACLAGWHGDAAVTVEVGQCRPELRQLSEATRQALWAGIAAVRDGGRIGDIGHAVETSIRAQPRRYGLVTDFTGHGIGQQMHLPPDVPNTGRRGRGAALAPGVTLAIEPMVTLGSARVAELDDEWTIVTRDGTAAAHWEHTVALTDHGLWVLTAADGGEAELSALGLPFGPLAD
ncbi:MAG: type I methionyl aminopeptidase [Propionicimonas sp.]